MDLEGSMFCSPCSVRPDDGTACKICGRTHAPERGGGNAAFRRWLDERKLTIPSAEGLPDES